MPAVMKTPPATTVALTQPLPSRSEYPGESRRVNHGKQAQSLARPRRSFMIRAMQEFSDKYAAHQILRGLRGRAGILHELAVLAFVVSTIGKGVPILIYTAICPALETSNAANADL